MWLARTLVIAFSAAALCSATLEPKTAFGQVKTTKDLKKGSPSGLVDPALVGRADQLLALKRSLSRDETLSVLKSVAQRKAADGKPVSPPTDLEAPIILSARTPASAGRAYLLASTVSWDAERGRITMPSGRSPASSITLKLKPNRRWQPVLIGFNVVAASEGTNVTVVSTGPGLPRSEQRFSAGSELRTLNFAFLGGGTEWHQVVITADRSFDLDYATVTLAR